MTSYLWDIGIQYNPRCDATELGVQFGAILFAEMVFIKNCIWKFKITPDVSKIKVDSQN